MNILDINSYCFTPYAIPHFTISICILGLMCFFYRAEGRTFVSYSLLLMSSSFLLWMFNDGMMYISTNKEVALWWAKTGYLGVTFLPASCLQFTFAVLGIYQKHKITVRWVWLISALFYLLSQFNSHFISGMQTFWWGYYSSFGWIGFMFIIFNMSIFAYCTWHFLIEYRQAEEDSVQRARAESCMVAFGIGYIGSLDYVATFGIALYPFGYAPVLVLLLILARTALRYRLNITPSFVAKNIIDTMSDSLVILAEDGTVLLTNSTTRQLFNMNKDQLFGVNFHHLTGWDIVADKSQLTACCPITNHPVTLRPTNRPEPVYLELSVSTMYEHNSILVFVCLLRDVTQETIADQEVIKYQDKLEQRVKNRSHELQVANHDLLREAEEKKRLESEKADLITKSLTQSKLASLGEIATGIAHEINQPLSFIRVILESTLKDQANNKLDNSELIDDCRESIKQVTRITTIINHLRTFGRSDDSKPYEPVALAEILDNTMILMRQILRLKTININIQIDDNVPNVRGNPVRLEQVFINLIQNSANSLADTKSPLISVTISKKDQTAVICFTDNGAGIPPEISQKIFEPFFSSRKSGEGTGLGLAIIHGIIKEHNGTIELLNTGNKTSFVITLPTATDEDE